MIWVLLDVAIAVLALLVLALVGLLLWRRVKALSRVVGTAGEQVGAATTLLADLQAARPVASGPVVRVAEKQHLLR